MEGYIHSVSGAIREFFHLIGDQGSFVVLEAILAVPTEDRNKPLLKCLPAICANGCLEPWAVDSLLANVIPACYPLAGESKNLKRKANLHLKRLLKRNKGALESTILEDMTGFLELECARSRLWHPVRAVHLLYGMGCTSMSARAFVEEYVVSSVLANFSKVKRRTNWEEDLVQSFSELDKRKRMEIGFRLMSILISTQKNDYLIRRTRVPDSPSEVSKSCDGSLRASDTLSEFSIPTIQLPPSLRPVMSSSNPSTPVKSWSPRCDDSPVSHSPSSSTMSSPISLTPTLSLEFPSASDKTIELYDNCAKIGAFMASVWPQVVKNLRSQKIKSVGGVNLSSKTLHPAIQKLLNVRKSQALSSEAVMSGTTSLPDLLAYIDVNQNTALPWYITPVRIWTVDHTLRWLADNSMSELKVHFSLHEIDGEMLLRLKKTSKIYAAFSHHPLRDTFSIKLDALRQDALKFDRNGVFDCDNEATALQVEHLKITLRRIATIHTIKKPYTSL